MTSELVLAALALAPACALSPPASATGPAVATPVASRASASRRALLVSAGASVAALTTLPTIARSEMVANPYAKPETVKADAGNGFLEEAGGNVLNLALTGFVLVLAAFIGSFALEAVKTLGDTSRNIAEALQEEADSKPKNDKTVQQGGFLYVDDNPNVSSKMSETKKGTRVTTSIRDKKKKLDFTKSETGFDFAPWMRIDQAAVAKAETERQARKRKEGKSGKK